MDFNCIKNIICFIYQLSADPISYIRGIQENLNTLLNSMDELMDLREDVGRSVEIREANKIGPTAQEVGWLRRAGGMEAIAEEVVRECSNEIRERRLGGFCPKNCCASYQLAKKLARIISEVDEQKRHGSRFEIVAQTLPPPSVQYMPTVPAPVMDLMVEKAWSCCINNERVGIMGIYGIGGVGKTTLLMRINNEFLHRRTIHFDVVIWVVVSNEVNAMKIQDDVATRLGLSLPSNESLQNRASKLHSALSKKTFVLLLDDLWRWVDLTAMGIPHPDTNKKSKVLFTTRLENVCGQMGCHKNMRVECLDWPEAWKLFQEKLGVVGQETLNSHPGIRAIAEDVAKECDGLPLALITIGRAMASKTSPQAWDHAVTILRRSASQFSGLTENVYYKLKLSYDSLEDDTIKSCFRYCSLFPEDYCIEIKELINYWIGEGFLDGFDTIEGAQNKGYDIIENLKQACLLESVLNSERADVKMHDVLRDLALWIGRGYGKEENKLLVRAGEGLTEVPEVGKWREAESISLMENNIITLEGEAAACPNLLTLIISENRYLDNISNDFFQYMPVLRVLDLSNTGIEVLPTSIGNLVRLQFLGLEGTEIEELPQDMKNLVELKYLGLRFTYNLKFIPCGVLSVLSKLQVLDISNTKFEHWEVNGGASIRELECLWDLKYLSIRIKDAASLKRLLDSKNLSRCTRILHINECLTPGILKPGHLPNICEVNIENCDELEELLWLSGAQNLESLEVSRCNRLKVICDGARDEGFPNLSVVGIANCNALKDLSWLRGSPNLKELHVRCCQNLQLIRDGERDVYFPNLQEITITECPKLKDLSWLAGVPNLEILSVAYCWGLELICDGNDATFSKLHDVVINSCGASLKDLSWLRGARNLELISINHCMGLELIYKGEDAEGGESQMIFPRLSLLFLEGLPELKSIPWHSFPSNTETLISDCPKATNTRNEEEGCSYWKASNEDENDEEEDMEDEEVLPEEEEDWSSDWEAGNEDENDEEEDVEDEEVLPEEEEDWSSDWEAGNEDENDEEEDVEDEEVLPDEEEDWSDLEAGNEDENVEEKDVKDEGEEDWRDWEAGNEDENDEEEDEDVLPDKVQLPLKRKRDD